MLRTNLKKKEYFAEPTKIIFKAVCGSNGCVKVSNWLRQFAEFDYLFVRINNEYKQFKIRERRDRGYISNIVYISKKHRGKIKAYLETTQHFQNILQKAEGVKENTLSKYINKTTKFFISEDGLLLLRFLTPSIKRSKVSALHNVLNKKVKGLTLELLERLVNELDINHCILSPFIENYYVLKTKRELKFPKRKLKSHPKLYRLLGLLNGDGHVSKYAVLFYGNDGLLHNEFEKLVQFNYPKINIKSKMDTLRLKRTYFYSTKVAQAIASEGGITGNKIKSYQEINFCKDFKVISEYLGGIFDTEGALIEDHHLVIPTCTSIYNKDYRIISEEDYEFLSSISLEKTYTFPVGKSNYKRISIKHLIFSDKGREIYNKIIQKIPILSLTNKKLLTQLGIDSICTLKTIYIYPETENINTCWWNEITSIKDVIKFASAIDIHTKLKREKLDKFISNYISREDYKELKQFVMEQYYGYKP